MWQIMYLVEEQRLYMVAICERMGIQSNCCRKRRYERQIENSGYLFEKLFLLWPIYLADTLEVKKWKAQYRGLLEMKEIPIDETVSDLVQTDKQFLAPDTVDNWYVWSKSLSKMRYEMIKNCDARICAGGRKVGYKGKTWCVRRNSNCI